MRKHNHKRRFPRNRRNLKDFKAFLGPLAEDYTDEELLEMQKRVHALAEILVGLSNQNDEGLPSIGY